MAIGRGRSQFSHIIQEQAAVVIRPLHTTDLSGSLDPGESMVDMELNIIGIKLRQLCSCAHRAASCPHVTYEVSLTKETLTDLMLIPATGWDFRFLANPGQTMVIDIPLQPLLQVMG